MMGLTFSCQRCYDVKAIALRFTAIHAIDDLHPAYEYGRDELNFPPFIYIGSGMLKSAVVLV